MAVLKGIDSGSGEGQHDGRVGVFRPEIPDRARAAPGMQGHHQVGVFASILFSNMDHMTKATQDTRPAVRGGAIAGFGVPRRRGYKNDPAAMILVQASQ